MPRTVTLLIAEPNRYFSLGLTAGLLTYFREKDINVRLSDNVLDKQHADMVFIAAEQDSARLRYLLQRDTGPAHQYRVLCKEKPSQHDPTQFTGVDGIFYRHQSLDWAIQIVSQCVFNLPLPAQRQQQRPLPHTVLTVREKEVLHYLSRGLRSCDISRYLRISEKTVSGHKRNAMTKLGITRTSDLNYWLLRGGVDPRTPLSEAIACMAAGQISAPVAGGELTPVGGSPAPLRTSFL